MYARWLSGTLVLSMVSGVAFAGVVRLPEPGVIELLAIGGVAALAAAIRRRRK